jgi:hypothetical protein
MLAASLLRDLRPEHELLLALARTRLTDDAQRRIRAFLAERATEIDWGNFLDQAARHMLLPLVSRHMSRLRLCVSEEGRTLAPYRWIYTDVYDGSRQRNQALGDEYARAIRAFNSAGLTHVVRKGPVLGQYVYGDPSARRISNLDVLMHRTDFPLFQQVATDLGYGMGYLAANGSTIVPFDRNTVLYWRVHLTNTALPYQRVGDRNLVENYTLSPWFSLFQPMTGVKDDGDELIENSVPTTLYGEKTRMLSPVDQLLDCAVHVHVRATMLYYIESKKDLPIRNFLDLVELLKRVPDSLVSEFRAKVEKYDCGDSVYYSFHFARQLYPDAVTQELVDSFRPPNVDFLDEYGGFDGLRLRWQKGFAERLFDSRRAENAEARSKVPGPRSII